MGEKCRSMENVFGSGGVVGVGWVCERIGLGFTNPVGTGEYGTCG